MKIAKECYYCIYTQAYNLTNKLKLSNEDSAKVLQGVAKILSEYYLDATPPLIAARVYDLISKVSGVDDPFKYEKLFSIKEALKLKDNLKLDFFKACKLAVAGNVIDLGVNSNFKVEEELEKIFSIDFKFDDSYKLYEEVKRAKSIVYLADNAGENIFDEILIKEMKKINNGKIFYFVRGKPVINDVTKDDLIGLEIEKLATIIDTKVPTPGYQLEFASEESKEIFYNADLVVSKGMGNFECLFKEVKREIFYMFKVKCEVVAREVKAKVGDYIILKD